MPPVFPNRLVGLDGATFVTSHPCPEYVVISYTWGRWKRKTRDRDTQVRGGHWMVPANDLFTRGDLDAAIRNIAGESNIWVDVLCIPQDDSAEMAAEIGKQSEIFRLASRAAVWLCSGGEEALVEICSAVPEETYMIPPDVLALHNPENIAEARRRLALVANLPGLIPWTTSLWTLQESALRVDAVFYSKVGFPLCHQGTGNPITIRHLISTLQAIHEGLEMLFTSGRVPSQGILDQPEAWNMCEEDVALVFQALDAVNLISLHKLANMNASELLLACAHRVCQRPHDRAYGIMGAIGVTVPVNYSADPSAIMNVFLVELHNTVPAEMQAFYREKATSAGGREWFVDEDSSLLTLVRQLAPPTRRLFYEVEEDGHLVASEVVYVSQSGLQELTTRALTKTLLPALNMGAVLEA
ncbi:hypothetical protein DL768_000260 [Monosporascus sp. mg162]|nr:hypothetical protein DL768_000260 [Monosporascus sp. mg162]